MNLHLTESLASIASSSIHPDGADTQCFASCFQVADAERLATTFSKNSSFSSVFENPKHLLEPFFPSF
jgi:hypothetical protein